MGTILLVTSPDAFLAIGIFFLVAGVAILAMSGLVASWGIIFIAATCNGFSVNLGFLNVRPEHISLVILPIMLFHMRGHVPSNVYRKSRASLILFSLGFIGWSIVASFSSPSPVASFWIILQYALGIVWLLPLAILGEVKVRLVRVGTLLIALVTLLSIFGYLTKFGGNGSGLGVSPTSGRIQGFSFEPNIFASQAVVWIAVMYFWRRQLTRFDKIAVMVIVLGILLAGTRSAWLALLTVGGIAVFNVLKRGSARSVFVGAMVIAAAVVTPVIVSALASTGLLGTEITYRLENLLESDSGTGAYRLNNIDVAFDDLSARGAWWTGLGANAFPQYHTMDSTGTGAGYLGSLWVTLIYDSGMIGIALFCCLFISAWLLSNRKSESIGVFAAISICAAFTNFLWFQYAWLSIAMVVGGAAQTHAFYIQNRPTLNRIRRFN
ncbi:O-antigen ligase family protein [Paenarthrobacter ureafaciens]